VVIRADRHRTDRALMAARHDGASRRVFDCQVPEPYRLVLAGSQQPVVIRADRHRTGRALTAMQHDGASRRVF
jgi:hypothetical protein